MPLLESQTKEKRLENIVALKLIGDDWDCEC